VRSWPLPVIAFLSAKRRGAADPDRVGRELLVEARRLWRLAQRTFEKELGRKTASELRSVLHRVAATEFALSS
jgi:hypothetical protein